MICPSPEPKQPGLFSRLVDKYKDVRQHSQNKEVFKAALVNALSDGVLTDEEVTALKQCREMLGLTAQDWAAWRVDLFTSVINGIIRSRQISDRDNQELGKIQEFLQVSPAEISSDLRAKISRSRILYQIQTGNLPPINVPNLILIKNEKAYWSEPSGLAEVKVVGRRYEGGSQGVSIRVMKGVSFRVGGHAGRVVSDSEEVIVDNGDLVITNQRLVFCGGQKSFASKLDKIIDIQPSLNGLVYSETNRQKRRKLLFTHSLNGDIICELLSRVLEDYQK